MFDMVQKQKFHSAFTWLLQLRQATLALLALGCFVCAFPSAGYCKGDGIQVGANGRFHPRLFANFGYDSNVFQRSSQTTSTSPLSQIGGSLFFSVRPGLELTVGTQSVSFLLAGYAAYNHYFSAGGLNTITAKADLALALLRDKPVSITITNNFSRSSGDSLSASDMFARSIYFYQAGTQTGGAFITHQNNTGLQVTIKPGGGALLIDIGYNFSFALYPVSTLDNNTHAITAGVKWNFFPRTAFTFETELDIVSFSKGFGAPSEVNNNAFPFKAYVGLVGQLTERLLLTFRIGGGYTLTQQGNNGLTPDNYGMVIGNVDLTYKIRLTTFIRLGFRHNFSPAVFSDFSHETIGYAEFGAQFGPNLRPFVFNIRADGGYIGYGKIPTSFQGGQFNANTINPDGTINRGDLFIRGKAQFDWHIYKFWMIGLLGRLEVRDSNTFIVAPGAQIGLGYVKVEVMFNTELAF